MTEYKLFNTDGKTFFDFRSNPDSRCEGFTVSYLDDGTVCMSGDYGCLCWKREYNGRKDYGFPSKETGINYFAEKVCQWGVPQKIEEYNKATFLENLKESYGDEENFDKFEEEFDSIDENDEWRARELASEWFTDSFETHSDKYTNQFKWNFERLQSVSDQIWEAVKAHEAKSEQENAKLVKGKVE